MTVIDPEDINRLKNLLIRGSKEPSRAPLLWAGAGISIPSGYPSLGQLAEKLRTKSPVPLPKDLAPMETIDAFVKENGKGDLAEALADIFDRKQPLPYHRDLMKLSWKAVITTNYDELLEDALKELDRKFIKVTLGENLDLTARPELPLFKIHGDLSGFRSMVLSGQSYADYGQRYALLKQDLESLLRKHHVVYFGCSMTDPRLIDWLESLGRENREQLMSSCAVMTEADWNRIPQETRTLLEEATVKPVFVKDHAQIPELISYLVKTVVGSPDRKELKLVNRIRIEAPENFPRFVYLASCHGNTPAKPDEQKAGSTITAAQLHKEGVVQVIGYFGPIVDELSTLAEEKIYRALAGGKKTRHAVRKARAALATGAVELCKSTHRDGAAKDVYDVFPFAWAQLVFYHRGPDHPLSLESPPGFVPQEAGLRREFLEESEHRRQLTTGFIGRRKQLHAFRRQLKNGRRVFVFQGLGGLGKSTLAFKTLPMLARQNPALTFWCQELEDDEDQAGALTTRLSDFGQMLFGTQWIDVVQAVDRISEATRADRFRMFLSALVEKLNHTVLHFENMESLLTGPDNEDPQAFANWKSPELEAIWHRVKKMASDKLSIVASCRYRNTSFEEDIVHVPEMGPNAIFRLMGWFEGLSRLSLPNRVELVSRVHGHPRAVEYLDDLVKDRIQTWESRYGQLPNAATSEESETQWREIVAPALPSAEQRLVQNLLLDTIWDRVLDERCRNMLFRMTVLRRPWDWDLMMELGEPGQEKELTEKTAGRLRGTSLLGELEEKRDNTWAKLFQIHPSTANFIRAKFDEPQAGKMHLATCLLIGTWLEKRMKKSRNIRDGMDAGHYLFECGEFDRAYDLLWSASQTLQQRGKVREGLLVLAEFEKQDALNHLGPQRAGRLLGTLGLAHHRLAEIEKAIGYYKQALAISREIGNRRGEGNDLGNLGLAYRDLGQVEQARKFLKEALAIGKEIKDPHIVKIAAENLEKLDK